MTRRRRPRPVPAPPLLPSLLAPADPHSPPAQYSPPQPHTQHVGSTTTTTARHGARTERRPRAVSLSTSDNTGTEDALGDDPVNASQFAMYDTTSSSDGEYAHSGRVPLSAGPSYAQLHQQLSPPQPQTGPLLSELPAQKRWRDWWTRFIWTQIMVGSFLFIIASGHMMVVAMVIGIQAMVFKEVIAIAHVPSKEKKLPWFRLINWYFLIISCYFLYGETLFAHFKENVLVDAFLGPLANHHRFACFGLYCIGFVFFVMNLKKGHYKFQFVQFFWTHMTLLIVVFQSHFIIDNILEGLIWFFLPVSLVICNDVFAYVGGFFFGRTRLIALSPKKTWEGFLTGFVCTLVFSVVVSRFLIQYSYMICPVKDLSTNAWAGLQCDPNPVFIPARYTLTPPLQSLVRHIFRTNVRYVTIAPLQWHALLMACFASFIAPFGGFFASGFKRAFKLKDFGQSIPGHGGVTDRMDCQFIMGLFSFMYYTTFIKAYEPVKASDILQSIVDGLAPREQLELYGYLRDYLGGQGLLPQPEAR